MTHKIAVWLGVLILIATAFDSVVFDSTALVFLLRKLTRLIAWMAFWR